MAATAAIERWGSATAASAMAVSTATAARLRCRGRAAAVMRISTATAVATLLRGCRGRDRQRGNARGEKHPAKHRKISFRTGKTVRPVHRSIA
jgi:hypothetical protein